MADKTAQVKQLPITLQTAAGAALSYADSAAFLAAGWTVVYEISGASVTPTYTFTVINATLGRYEIGLTLQYGKGTFYLVPPAGLVCNVEAFILDVEDNSIDNIAGLILSSAGTPSVDTGITTYQYQVTEGDSFNRELTVALTALAYFGYTDLTWVSTATAAARTAANRLSTSPDFTLTADVTDAANRIVVIGWSTFPTGASISGFAITAVSTGSKTFKVSGDKRAFFTGITALRIWNSTANDGAYTVVGVPVLSSGDTVFTVSETIPDSTVDGTIAQDAATKDFFADIQFRGFKTFAITAVSTVTHKFTISGDQTRYFSVGGTFIVSGSTGNDPASPYTITALTYTGGNTEITIGSGPVSAVADGNIKATIVMSPIRLILTVSRQEDRT